MSAIIVNNKPKYYQRSNSSLKESDFKTPLIHKNVGISKVQQPQLSKPKEMQRTLSYYGSLLTEGRPLKLSDYTDMDCIISPDINRKGGLFLGNINGAKDIKLLKEKNIGAVLTVMINSQVGYKGMKGIEINHMVFSVDDADYVNLSQYFDRAKQFIDSERQRTNVFVHCYAGISRSASIVISYIMQKQSLSFSDAFQFVKQKRKIISPNLGFQKQLKSFEYILKERALNYRKQILRSES